MGAFLNAISSSTVKYNDTVLDRTFNLGDGNHSVTVAASNVNISTGNGSSSIKHYGNNSTITTGDGDNEIKSIGREKTITTGNGNQKITSIGSDVNITTGDGDDDVTFVGHNCDLDVGNGNNNIVFWGDNANIKAGDGDDTITTYDQVYKANGGNQELDEAFLSTLSTSTYENWTLKDSELIDYWCRKGFFKKKQVWVYANHYDVETILRTNVDGVKNANIDLGGGTNTGNINLSTDSTTSNCENVESADSWSWDTSLGHRDEVQITTQVKKNMRWGNVALAGVALIGTVGAVGALVTGCVGAAAATSSVALYGGTSTAIGAQAVKEFL